MSDSVYACPRGDVTLSLSLKSLRGVKMNFRSVARRDHVGDGGEQVGTSTKFLRLVMQTPVVPLMCLLRSLKLYRWRRLSL